MSELVRNAHTESAKGKHKFEKNTWRDRNDLLHRIGREPESNQNQSWKKANGEKFLTYRTDPCRAIQ